jgi:hypothetical protein
MSLATCIGCGCDDNHACFDREFCRGCYWIRLDRAEGKGVCSECEEHVEAWDRGDRTNHAESAELVENPPRIPRPEQPRPAGIELESGVCRTLASGDLTIRFGPKIQRCSHDWPFEDVQDSDCCRWCGMSFLYHIFTEMP